MNDRADTAAAARVLLILDAAVRVGFLPISDMDLARLAYFVDAFCPLWNVRALDPFRLKQDEPYSIAVRLGLDRLVFSGVAVPEDVSVLNEPRPHVTAHYRLDEERAGPGIAAIHATEVGVREATLVDEVVFAASQLSEDRLSEAFRLDASMLNDALGPKDVVDLYSPATTTSVVAARFDPGVRTETHREAELTHLYLAHLDRILSDG